MSATDPAAPDPGRFSIRLPRPLWIGLATVVLVVVAVGLRIGAPIYRQHVAIREIERGGGVVQTKRPSWMNEWTQDKRFSLFDEVTEVYLGGSNFSDADLACVRELTAVRILTLYNTQVTDAGLVHLNCLSRLEHLDIRNTQVTDAGLSKLNGLVQLKVLNYSGPGVTKAGVAELKKASPLLKIRR